MIDNNRKIAIDLGDNYTTGCQLDYNQFNNYYKMIAIDFRKQQALDANPKAIQHTKSILLQIQIKMEMQQFFSLLKKQKKQFQIFHKEL